jgi:DNA-binding SARP family transcriptional activator
MARYYLKVFGVPELSRDGIPLYLTRKKALAALVYLAATGRTISRSSLCSLLWARLDQRSAEATLRTTLSALRELAHDGVINVNRRMVALATDGSLRTDIEDLDEAAHRLVSINESGSSDIDYEGFLRAIEPYSAGFLTGFSIDGSAEFDTWTAMKSEQLRSDLLRVLNTYLGHAVSMGDHEWAIRLSMRYLHEDPLAEDVHALLIGEYAALNRPDLSAMQYRKLATTLSAEMGTQPRDATQALYKEACESLGGNESYRL